MVNSTFWNNKRVFITGHTGFKGSWLSVWLQAMGAKVSGYSLPPITDNNLFNLASVADNMVSILDDIRNTAALDAALSEQEPEIIFHLAAQPLVRLSYTQPVETYSTNIMGTVNLLEAVRTQKTARVVVVITSDKCYENNEWLWGYRENEPMGGKDPYSSSKACAELICAAYRSSFFQESNIALATARAGNVIGGGDWSQDRLVPDILKAAQQKTLLLVRNPLATRPWQHVIEPLGGYLLLAEKLWDTNQKFASGWNFGPSTNDVRSVEWIINHLSSYFDEKINREKPLGIQPQEARLLSLDSTKAHALLGWETKWSLEKALSEIALWHKAWLSGKNMRDVCLQQIFSYSNS